VPQDFSNGTRSWGTKNIIFTAFFIIKELGKGIKYSHSYIYILIQKLLWKKERKKEMDINCSKGISQK
jgi:hypothetical protein